jgi:2-polyprenyl-3-methyl-5-hydroxy-6-metoxy-1,4-benzoquinol methylase
MDTFEAVETRQNLEAPRARSATFRDRTACVVCGSSRTTDVWSGRFSDVRARLDAFRYAIDLDAALGNESFRLMRCLDCDMCFHRRVMTREWLRELYSQWIDGAQIEAFEATVRPGARERAKFERGRQMVKHLLRLDKLIPLAGRVRTLLDFGCGDGDMLGVAATFGFAAYGVDFSSSRADRALHRGVTLVSDLEAFDALGTGPLDCITTFETLEHVDEPAELLQQLASRLRPGGVLVVEVPNCDGIGVPRTASEFNAVQPLEHINAFTPRTLRTACERAGFRPVDKPPAHVTTRVTDLAKTEASRFVRPPTTAQYFRLGA